MEEKDKELVLAALKKLLKEIEEEEDDLNRFIKMTERFGFHFEQLGLGFKECLQEVHEGRQSLVQLLRRQISMLMEDRYRDRDDDDHDEANFERIVRDNVEKIRRLLVGEVRLFSNLEDCTDSISSQDDDDRVVAMDGGDKEEKGKEAIESSVDSNENIISDSATEEEEEEEVVQKRSSWELRMEEIQDLHQSCQALRVKLEKLSNEAAAGPGPGPGPGPSSSAVADRVIVSDDKDPETEVKTEEDRTQDDPEKKTPSTSSTSSSSE